MMQRRRRWAYVSLLAILAIVFSSGVKMPYRLLYNPSESAPRGWYYVVPAHDIGMDDFVVVHLPVSAAQLAADRGYLPRTVPLLKHVAAVSGQRVCERDGLMMINGVFAAKAHSHDGVGRSLIAWTGCRRLAADELFLLSHSSEASFDSRYFGPVHRSSVMGRAIPLWIW